MIEKVKRKKVHGHSWKISFLSCFLIISMILISPNTVSQDSGMGMPDWTKSIEVTDHYIIIDQDESNNVEVEELIWFHNKGMENFTGHLFVWSQPNTILVKISQFGFVIDESFKASKVYPSEHSPNFFFANLTEENRSIAPDQTVQISYKYNLKYSETGDFTFQRIFLYNNSNVIVIIKTAKGIKAEGQDSVELIYDKNSNSYITPHSYSTTKKLGDTISILFTTSEDTNDDNGDSDSAISDDQNFFYLIIIIVIAIIIAVVLLRMRKSKK